MFNQIILSIGRKVSAHLYTTCIICILFLFLMIGGLIQVISSVALSKYIENGQETTASQRLDQTTSMKSLIPSHSTILLGPSTIYGESNPLINTAEYAKQNRFPEKSIHSAIDVKSGDEKNFLSTKILYKPYSMNNGKDEIKQKPFIASQQNKEQPAKSKSINSTIIKKVTPSITDRVIADLKKEEYLASQQKNRNSDIGDGYDDAIYIDADDEELNTAYSIPVTETESYVDPIIENKNLKSMQMEKKKITSNNYDIGIRDKKSPKKPLLIKQQQYESHGLVDIADSSESISDDEDDDYGDFNSGSGDFNSNQLSEQDWRLPAREEMKLKNMIFKQERSSIDDTVNSDEMDNIDDTISFNDADDANTQQQIISKKIAHVHKKQYLMQSIKNQKPKPESKQPIYQKSISDASKSKRKFKNQRYNDESFSGKKFENSGESQEQDVSKYDSNGWIEPRIRRILDNIKRSEERSQQILLCKGEGELCSMLFKTPIKPIDTP